MERLPTETRTCVDTRPITVSHHESVAIFGNPFEGVAGMLLAMPTGRARVDFKCFPAAEKKQSEHG
jgi:hypothetical protein